MKIVAFGHRKQVGKNEAALHLERALVENGVISFKTVAFADKLYEVAHTLYAWAGFYPKQHYEQFPKDKEIVLPDIGKTPRQILYDLGTKGVRGCVYDKTFVKCTLNLKRKPKVLIVSDLRFPLEFDELWSSGALILRVVNPRVPEDPQDKADAELRDETRWHADLVNDGDLDLLHSRVWELCRDYIYG
jgi:hypothetical protein